MDVLALIRYQYGGLCLLCSGASANAYRIGEGGVSQTQMAAAQNISLGRLTPCIES